MTSLEVGWAGLEQGSVERCAITAGDDGAMVAAAIDFHPGMVDYRVRIVRPWLFCELSVVDRRRQRAVRRHVVRDVEGHWYVDGRARPDLGGAHEIDLAISPLSNTLPIRRLGLEIGESAEIVTAYVGADLDVSTDPQRYTRIAERRYLYESLDSAFSREVTVDEHGLVLDYPSLFQRV